jgi:Uma2 family endonuclease
MAIVSERSPPAVAVFPEDWTLADLHQQLGGIPLERIRLRPTPGMATEQDVIEAERRYDRLCELVDGVLVEKVMGYKESRLAFFLGHALQSFLDRHNLGAVAGADGTLKILPRQVRIPDVSFIRWERFPGGKVPDEPIPALAPDLAVEVLSPGNTEAEMQRKLRDYFTAGVRLVWYVDPPTRTARVYTAVDQCQVVAPDGVLSGGDVLPGFELSMAELFARAERSGPGETTGEIEPTKGD